MSQSCVPVIPASTRNKLAEDSFRVKTVRRVRGATRSCRWLDIRHFDETEREKRPRTRKRRSVPFDEIRAIVAVEPLRFSRTRFAPINRQNKTPLL